MVDLKGKRWLIPLLGGILVILFAVLPIMGYTRTDPTRILLHWITGFIYYDNDGNIATQFLDDPELIALGVAAFITMLISGIILVLSALLTMMDKSMPYKALIWLILGITIVILPVLYTASVWTFTAIFDLGDAFEFLIYGGSTLMLIPIAGVLAIVSGTQELAQRYFL